MRRTYYDTAKYIFPTVLSGPGRFEELRRVRNTTTVLAPQRGDRQASHKLAGRSDDMMITTTIISCAKQQVIKPH